MHVRPLPGIGVGRVLEVLKELHTGAVNIRSQGRSVVDLFNSYQRWSNSAVRMLERTVDPASVNRLVTSPRYWVLQTLVPTDHGDLAGLVNLELDTRIADLDEAVRSVQTDAARYSDGGLFVIPDTNALVHQPEPFDRLEWGLLAGARLDATTLFIPMVVIDELDNLKRSAANKKCVESAPETVRSRARTTLRSIDDLFPKPSSRVLLTPAENLKGPVYARLLLDLPGHSRADRADDEIADLARALADYSGRRVMVATADTGLRTRCRLRGVETLDLP